MSVHNLVGKDEVREMMGGCSDQMAYKIIRKLTRELEGKGIITVQGKVSKQYLIERLFGAPSEKEEGQCR